MKRLTCDMVTDIDQRELVKHGTLSFPIACYDEDLSVERVPWHWHDEWEFILVTEGTVVILLESTQVTMNAGDGLFINAGALHAIDHARSLSAAIHSAVFHPRLIGASVDSVYWEQLVQPLLHDTAPRYVLLDHCDPAQHSMLEDLHAAWNAIAYDQDDCENLARYLLSRVWRALCRCCSHANSAQTAQDRIDGERIRAMLSFIDENLAGELTVKTIANSMNISESVCLRCFQRMLGFAPMQYVKQARLDRAAELLRSTSMTAKVVALECGFHDVSYFTKSFREKMGCTPKAYQRKE